MVSIGFPLPDSGKFTARKNTWFDRISFHVVMEKSTDDDNLHFLLSHIRMVSERNNYENYSNEIQFNQITIRLQLSIIDKLLALTVLERIAE